MYILIWNCPSPEAIYDHVLF